jgi:peptidyl-prolyl cis-trans isomerase C
MHSTIGTTRAAGLLPAMMAGLIGLSASFAAGAETVKTVNGVAIDSSVLEFYMQSRTNRPPAQVSAEERDMLLNELTDIYLLTTQASAADIQKEPQIAAQIELQRRGILAQAIASRFFESATVSDEQIAAEYESQRAMAPPMQYKARHILVESQGEAADIIKSLDEGGDFIETAKTRSTGPSGPNGGDLGWFSPNQMVAPFSNAVSELEDGAYTKSPVQTEFGWHVILREDSREAEAPPLDTVRNEIEQVLQQRQFQQHLENLRSTGKIGD